ncbi:MAG: flagellar hook-associated protein FlgL [Campylobacterota bacterium]|nr:flagellar hook-associated protein FlgL [Campylobacterota bacterium]
MRVTTSMYYQNIQSQTSKSNERLFDVNKQISSGLKIQYAKDDVGVFTETMRLDNEIATLGQIQKSVESGCKVANQTDTLLNEFQTTMDRTRVLLIQASNGSQSDASQDAIANELRGIEEHFRTLANSSINGQYLFSGSATDVKPISCDGIYMGNDLSMNSFVGAGVEQQYNLTGAELFLGEEILVKRQITSNVPQYNLSAKYPDFTDPTVAGVERKIVSSDTIRDLMGDNDDVGNVGADNHFYLSGVKSDGVSFNKQISMSDDDTIDKLLTEIGDAYGNSADLKLVNVTLNSFGEIVIEDKIKGSSKLDFHMVGAVDYYHADGTDHADVTNLGDLDSGESNFDKIMHGTSTAINSDLYIKEFIKSPFTSANATNIDAINYDKTQFTKDGSLLSSNISQIISATNAFALPSTKISEVADLSQGVADTLDGTQFTLLGTDTNNNSYTAQIDFKSTANGGSTFTINGNSCDIFNMESPRVAVDADEMTYRQLMDVINMAVTGNIPTVNNEVEYEAKLASSNAAGSTFLSYDGKINFEDVISVNTQATIALYDSNSGDFSTDASVISFNSNNALTIRDPKTDFFKTLDKMITAVEEHKLYPDSQEGDVRSVGMENAIAMLDDLMEHVGRSHSMVGAQSNSLTHSLERTQILEISTMTLRSSVLDTDLAEASLRLTQLTLNHEAMLYTVDKVSKLSLVNYL